MASSHCSNLPAKSFHFFKIVLAKIGSHSKLMIPEKFIKKFGKNLDNRIHLSAPSGSVWSIDLEKHKGEVWLQNGWPEFAKFYSIRFGYLLVFEYQGDSKFKVVIFDPSAVEIDYPSTCSAHLNFLKSTQAEKRENDMNVITFSDVISPLKKTRASSSCVEPFHEGQQMLHEKANLHVKPSSKICALACNVKTIDALSSSKAFKSNPYFIISVQPSHVRGTTDVYITKSFEETYKKWMNNVEVVLKVGSRSWQVYCRLNSKTKRCAFTRGWAEFARDNSLNVGDVCVFELINPSRKLFKVHVRATIEANIRNL